MFQCGKPDARLEFAVVAGPSAVGPAAADVGLVRLPNFRGLVLGCMDSYDSEQRLILQGFSRKSTVTAKWGVSFHRITQTSDSANFEFRAVQKNAHLVDVENGAKCVFSSNRSCPYSRERAL